MCSHTTETKVLPIRGRSRGQPGGCDDACAAWRGSPRAAFGDAQLQIRLSQIGKGERCGGALHSPFKGWRRRASPRDPSRGPPPHSSNCKYRWRSCKTKLGLSGNQIRPCRGRSAAVPPAFREPACRPRCSFVKAARRGSRAPPREGSLSLCVSAVISGQNGRRRLDADAQEARP